MSGGVGIGAAGLVGLVERSSRAREVLRRLGLDADDALDALDAFSTGPVVVGVVGSRGSGRAALVDRLGSATAGRRLEVADVSDAAPRRLWDAVVLATPAEAVLSQAELELARALSSLQRPVVVVVTGCEVFGEGAARRAAEDEITRFRLLPLLGPLGVPWLIADREGALDGVEAELARRLEPLGEALHLRPGLDRLDELLQGARRELEERVALRDRQRAILSDLEAQLSPVFAHAEEVGRRVRLRFRDDLRVAEQRLMSASLELCGALADWAIRGAPDEPEDQLATFARAWRDFEEGLDAAVARPMEELDSECLRVCEPLFVTAATLDVELEAIDLGPRDWLTEAGAERLRALQELQTAPMLEPVVEQAREAARRRDRARSSGTGDDQNEGRWKRWIEELSRALPGSPLSEQLATSFLASLEVALQPSLRTLLEVASETLSQRTAARNALFRDQLASRVAAIRDALDQRFAWSGDYGALLELIDDVKGARRGGRG